jgi:hypothetical protein
MFGVGFSPQTGLLWVAVAFLLLFGLGWGPLRFDQGPHHHGMAKNGQRLESKGKRAPQHHSHGEVPERLHQTP